MNSKPEVEPSPRIDSSADEILRRIDDLPVLDNRTPDELMGYDEIGLPK